MFELSQCFGLDLSNSFARHRELLADLLQCVVPVEPMPKRMGTMRSSRGVSEAKTRVVVSRRFDWIAASIGRIVFWSSIKSPRLESPSSPIGVWSVIGLSWASLHSFL